ncbi:DnaD domain protein [Bacillus cereus]|uniref:DnaD domain-containing protein n=1 Tax=Bacillus cereus TaxID=1396 RepID=UPI002040EF8F|nr:DnaD domain protein [Bacillus cereus]MCM3223355.1 DnaD domain protein [Bacillus cereus]
MAIFRVRKDNNYSVINNTGLKDQRLSWKAKGILAYALTLPDAWEFHINELSQHAKDGKDSLRSGLSELKKYGYLKRYAVRDKQTQKIVSWETEIHETPVNEIVDELGENEENPGTEEPLMENPEMGNPHLEKPLMENPMLLNTNNILSTNKLNTNISNTNHHHDDRAGSKSHVLVNEEFKISYNFLEGEGIPLSEIAIAELGEFCNLFGSELIKHATNKAIDANAPRWNYIKTVLENWQKQKVKTIDDVTALDRRFEMSRGKKSNKSGGNGSKRTELVPDWLREEDDSSATTAPSDDKPNVEDERKRLEAVLQKYNRK